MGTLYEVDALGNITTKGKLEVTKEVKTLERVLVAERSLSSLQFALTRTYAGGTTSITPPDFGLLANRFMRCAFIDILPSPVKSAKIGSAIYLKNTGGLAQAYLELEFKKYEADVWTLIGTVKSPIFEVRETWKTFIFILDIPKEYIPNGEIRMKLYANSETGATPSTEAYHYGTILNLELEA